VLPVLLALGRGSLVRFRTGAFPWVAVLVLTGLTYLLWNTVRESQQRFLLPLAVPLSVAAATGLVFPLVPRWLRIGGAAVLLASALGALSYQGLRLGRAGMLEFALLREWNNEPRQRARLREYYRKNLAGIGEVAGRVSVELPADARLLLVHEARPYLFPIGTQYCTIWDAEPLLEAARSLRQSLGRTPQAGELRQRLIELGITHILVNREELLRYIRQYARPEQYQRAGIARQTAIPEPAMQLLLSTATPEDYYPPWTIHPDWKLVRGPVIDLLRELRREATITTGVAPLEIWVAPLSGTNPAD
jgi:hypothetical protein